MELQGGQEGDSGGVELEGSHACGIHWFHVSQYAYTECCLPFMKSCQVHSAPTDKGLAATTSGIVWLPCPDVVS